MIVVLSGYLFKWHWTGLPRTNVPSNTQPGKTLWDWLDLLIVPAVLAIGGYWFNSQQNARRAKAEKKQRKEDQRLADERAEHERDLAGRQLKERMKRALGDGDPRGNSPAQKSAQQGAS